MPPNSPNKIYLGIDPGIARTGYGVIEVEAGKEKLLDYGCIVTPAKVDLDERLVELHQALQDVITKWRPDYSAVEELYFAKNAKTALTVGQARGVILLTLRQNYLPIRHFTPLQVKQALSGYGQADKKQIQEMVKTVPALDHIPQPDDAADAIAIAICAAQTPEVLSQA